MSEGNGANSPGLTTAYARQEQLLEAFEAAWRRGERPALDDYLPKGAAEPDLLLNLLQADLEFRLKAGEPARVEDYLRRFPEVARGPDLALALITREYRLRQHQGPTPDLEEYARRFPQYRAELARALGLAVEEAATLPSSPEPPEAPCAAEATLAPAATAPAVYPTIPGYEILNELGRGGMGVVYQARQVRLQRLVALKMILAGTQAGPQDLARFRTEAEAVARLQHPNIVQIHEVGEHLGLPYFSLEYVNGGSLAQQLDGTPLPAAEAARLVATLAQAVQAAHQQGIVHRDLKPANILLQRDEARGTRDENQDPSALAPRPSPLASIPKIADFGLAKKLDEAAGQTATGVILGTPSYMAPEQAEGKGKQIGPAADLYALGAILYELLTGRPPFRAGTPLDTVLQVVQEEPVPPRRLQPKVPRDLETICLKCLAKEPLKRYLSAAALVDDLNRFLANKPIQARPARWWERAGKWARRRPAVAALLLILLLVVVGSFAAMIQLWQRAEGQRNLAEGRLVDLQLAQGLRLMEEGDLFGALPWLVNAWQEDKGGPERETVHRQRLAGVLQSCPRLVQLWVHDDRVIHAAFSPDGRRVVTASEDKTARVWDVATGQRIASLVGHTASVLYGAFSPDGERVVTAGGEDKTARVWDAATGQAIGPPLKHEDWVWQAVFSADGRQIATASDDRTARIWDAVTGRPVRSLKHNDGVRWVAFLPGGERILTAGGPEVRIWDAGTGRLLTTLEQRQWVQDAVFSPPDGRYVVTTDWYYRKAQVWDAATGQPVGPPLKHQHYVESAAFSPDGRRVVTASHDHTAQVWEASTGQYAAPPLRHNGSVIRATFSPDGRRIVTVSDDQAARVWDAITGQPLSPPLRHSGAVRHAAFSPDGHRLVTTSEDHTVRVWDFAALPSVTPNLKHDAAVLHAAFSPDGRRLVTASEDRTAQIWDAATGQPIAPPLKHPSFVWRATFSPDGRRVVSACGAVFAGTRTTLRVEPKNSCARVWDAETGQPIGGTLQQKGIVWHAAFSPDGERVIIASSDNTAQMWDVASSQRVGPAIKHSDDVFHAAFSPDGRHLVTASGDGTARVWDADTGQPVGEPMKHERLAYHAVYYAAFSPDSRRVVTASEDCTAQVWDAATGQPLLPAPLKHNWVVFHAAFSPDGRRLATASWDRTARIWDATSGQPLTAPLRHNGLVRHVAFSPDGRRLATAADDRTARVWDTATGQLLLPPLRHAKGVWQAVFSPDGRRLVTASEDGTARLWDLPTDERPLEDWRLLGRLFVGELDRSGGATGLDATSLAATWQQLRAKYPHDFVLSAEEVLAWQRREVDACEAAEHWFGAIWHLNRLILVEPANGTFYLRRSRAEAVLGQWDRADADQAKALELHAKDWRSWQANGIAYAQQGHWDKAAVAFAQSMELGGTDEQTLDRYALVLAATGDTKGYRRACAALLDQFGQADSKDTANRVAWACVRVRGAVDDPMKAVALAEKAVAWDRKDPDYRNTLGAALYRAGRYEAALVSLQEAVKLCRQEGEVRVWLWLALVHHQLGHADEARQWLNKAVGWIEQTIARKAGAARTETRFSWEGQLEWQLLRNEVEALVK